MDQFLTYKKAKIGPVFNFTAYIYIYWLSVHTLCESQLTLRSTFKVDNWSASQQDYRKVVPEEHKWRTPKSRYLVFMWGLPKVNRWSTWALGDIMRFH